MLYLWGFYLLLFSLKIPIYKDQLSILSQYRYLLISLIVISISFLFLAYLLNISSSCLKFSIQNFISKITYPYLKEEVRLILYTWNIQLFSSLCSKLIDKFHNSKIFLFAYITNHFIIFYIPRVAVLFLFTKFVWFDGDLRLVICSTPILFLSWFLSFFDYYFQIFFKNHCNYIRSILNAKQVNPVPSSFGTIYTSLDNITFNLTLHGLDQGYVTENMPVLIDEWHIAAYLSVYFEKYNQFLVNFNRFLWVIQVINGFNLTYYFFFKPYLQTKYVMLSALFKRAPFQGGGSHYYATEASRILTKTGKQYLFVQTRGVQSGNHPPLIDRAERNPDNPSEIRYHGQITHGKGTQENPSVPLHPSKDLQGVNRPQNYVPARGCEYYAESLFDKNELPGSTTYLTSYPARENLAKHKAQEENT
jgi:hypothetical protein